MKTISKRPTLHLIVLFSIVLSGCSAPLVSGSSSSISYLPDASEAQVPEFHFSSSDYLYAPQAGDRLQITALEQVMNAGDATLFKYGDYEILVDGGMPDLGDHLSEVLREQVSDGVLDLLILTHQHYDHFGGLSSTVLKNGGIKKVTMFVDNGVLTYNADYQNIWVEGTKPYLLSQGSIYHPVQDFFSGSLSSVLPIAPDLTLAFLDSGYYPVKDQNGVYRSRWTPNEESVGFVLYAGDKEIVSLGDSIMTTEANYLQKYADHPFRREKDKVVFKANHHAADNANSASFMDFIHPDYCYISCAISSLNSSQDGIISLQPPFPKTRSRIEEKTGVDNVYWTGTTGDLLISFEEGFSDISIAGEGRKLNSYYYLSKLVDSEKEKNLPVEKTAWAKGEKEAVDA